MMPFDSASLRESLPATVGRGMEAKGVFTEQGRPGRYMRSAYAYGCLITFMAVGVAMLVANFPLEA